MKPRFFSAAASLLLHRRLSPPLIAAARRLSDQPRRRRPGPHALYQTLVQQGRLQHDPYQDNVARELEGLLGRLEQYEKEMEEYHENLRNWESSREDRRRKLMLEEAEYKQQSGVGVGKGNRFFDMWMSRRRRGNIEPGVGKMVSYINREKKLDSQIGQRPIEPAAPKGLYLYGNVGSGKTMLMDMFYGATEGIVKHRRRFHFHEAMLEIHEHMHAIWKNQVEDKSLQSNVFSWISNLPFDSKVKEWLIGEERYKQEVQRKHILPAVADKFLVDRQTNKTGASILCFDEIQTVDVFAIVALSGILSRLLGTGTVLVATSNRAPEELNQDGMQRDIFLSFLSKLEESCKKVPSGSEIDYRRLLATKEIDESHYFWPSDSDGRQKYEAIWHEVVGQSGGEIASDTISVMFGRALEVPESCNGIARFNFEYLCGRPIGAADYIAIARNYHTVFISDIPVMSMRIRDKVWRAVVFRRRERVGVVSASVLFDARRFITLIDELYNHHCCLFCLAAAPIDDLFQGTEEGKLFDLESFQFETEIEGGKLRRDVLATGSVGSGPAPSGILSMLSGEEEIFAFRRAVSRLFEMQTPLYIEGAKLYHPLYQQHYQQHSNSFSLVT